MFERPRLIFWLLFSATVCVDAVAIFSISPIHPRGYSLNLYLGLAFGQLGAAVAWCIFKADHLGFSWLLPYFGCFVAGLFVAPDGGQLNSWNEVKAYSILFSVYVTLLFVLLWLVKQIHSHSDRAIGLQPWQLSIKHLLVVTTVVASLTAAITRSVLFTGEALLIVVPWMINHLCVALIVVLLQISVRDIRRRVIGMFIAAFITWMPLSFVIALISRSTSESGSYLVINLIHASVLLLWVDLGGIIAPPFGSIGQPLISDTPSTHKPTKG